MDSVSKYSVTDSRTADQQTTVLKTFTLPDSIITDGTACVGGNTISFARSFRKVNAVEVNAERFAMLRENCSVLQVDQKVSLMKGDYSKIHHELKQDVVFLDPPWGGKHYLTSDLIQLFIGGIPIPEFCSLIRKANPKVKIIGLKVPVNYRMEDLLEEANRTGTSLCSYNFGKQILVVLDYGRNPARLREVHKNVMKKLPKYVKARVLSLRAEPGGGYGPLETLLCG